MAGPRRPSPRPTPGGRQLARIEPVPPSQVVAAAGTAVVTAARVGRLLGRSGWGIARRLPGGQAIEQQARRLQDAALTEVRRLVTAEGAAPQHSADEQRVMMLIQQAQAGADPLRSAMSELLERAVEGDRTHSQDYLFGNIISQLVPDEARILAALSDGTAYAAIDVVAKPIGRAATRTVLANASTVGRQAGVMSPDSTPTYVSRLYRFGLVEFGPPTESLAMQFDILATDSAVQAAEATIEARREGSPRHVRKALTMSQFGREFWAACDPSRPALPGGARGANGTAR